ncbi:MAG: hypothetical protein WCS15_02725, partial [Prevotella sp.]
NAQWFCTPDTLHKGSFWVKNVATGRYLNVANIGLTTSPTTTYPVYNNTDNGKYAFSVYASLTNTTSLSIGTIDADGLGGSLQNFPGTANRTRLRWIFDATGDVSTTGIKSPITTRDNGKNDAWYNLVGIKVSKPSKGIYIHKGKAVLVP